MKFSICIPNYNYEQYLGITLKSILDSINKNIEVVVSDNASTDGSLKVIQEAKSSFKDFKYQVNPVNLGFAANLDKAASQATGDYMIMLSSDDLMDREALVIYEKLFERFPNVMLSSACEIIDGSGVKTGRINPDSKIWKEMDKDADLSAEFGCDVYRLKSEELLKRSFSLMATPFNFCTVAYPRTAYVKVGGYESSRSINPDKWFHWKLLTEVPEAIYVDKGLFRYRWHNQNQTAQQQKMGYLKYMVDEYRNVMDITDKMLAHAGVNKDAFVDAYISRDIFHHGIGEFSKGRWLKSLRIFFFGLSTFPSKVISRPLCLVFILLLLTTPVGAVICNFIRSTVRKGQ